MKNKSPDGAQALYKNCIKQGRIKIMNYIKVTTDEGHISYLNVGTIRYLIEAKNGGTFICTERTKRHDRGAYVQEDIETVYARIQDAKKR